MADDNKEIIKTDTEQTGESADRSNADGSVAQEEETTVGAKIWQAIKEQI